MPKAKKKVVAKKKKVQASKKKVVKAVKKKVVKAVKKKVVKAVKKKVAKRKKVAAIQKGYNVITAYLIVNHAAKAIDFYKKVFGAKEQMRMEHGGKVTHAELKFGDSKIMLGDACPEMNACSPDAIGGTPVGIHIYVKDVDAVVKSAVAAGAKLEREVVDMFYGDRSGSVVDPFGHRWFVATHVEDVTAAQMKKRLAAMAA